MANKLSKVNVPRIIRRICASCGNKFKVFVDVNGKYSGGKYFGKINVNSHKTDKWHYILKPGWKDFLKDVIRERNPLYDPKVKRKYVEYWECDSCYNRQD